MNIYIFAIVGFNCRYYIRLAFTISYTYKLCKLHRSLFCALDAVFGGSRAALERTFDLSNFVLGFFSNVVLAVILVYVGDLIGINLYYVALIGFGLHVFINVGAIRKIIMTKRF
ncbi:MAG: DUF1290 domain-containing protein [Veillonella sp.]